MTTSKTWKWFSNNHFFTIKWVLPLSGNVHEKWASIVAEKHLTRMFPVIYIYVMSNALEPHYTLETCSHGPHCVHFGWWKHSMLSSWPIIVCQTSPMFGLFACNQVCFSLNSMHWSCLLTIIFFFLDNILYHTILYLWYSSLYECRL